VQATVTRFDPETGSGSVVTDAGVLLGFPQEAFAGSGLRHLRSGQRLTVTVSGDGRSVVAMRLETVGVVPPAQRS
jgi:2-phospho-L-lactate/phosphoenolpyruvate guanylyltransferase